MPKCILSDVNWMILSILYFVPYPYIYCTYNISYTVHIVYCILCVIYSIIYCIIYCNIYSIIYSIIYPIIYCTYTVSYTVCVLYHIRGTCRTSRWEIDSYQWTNSTRLKHLQKPHRFRTTVLYIPYPISYYITYSILYAIPYYITYSILYCIPDLIVYTFFHSILDYMLRLDIIPSCYYRFFIISIYTTVRHFFSFYCTYIHYNRTYYFAY